MASVERITRGWRARWRTPEGQSRSKTFERKIDAQRHLAAVEHDKLRGRYVDPAAGRISFRDYAEEWRRVQVHRASTTTSAEQHLRLHVYPVLGTKPMATIRPTEIQGLVTQLTTALAPSTVAVVYGRVVAVFRAAVRDRIISRSPCVGIRLPRQTAKNAVEEVLTTDQVLALAGEVPERYGAAILVAAGLGLRPGELFGLTVDRVEFLRHHVRIDRQLVRRRGVGVELGLLKTSSSYRTLPLPDIVNNALAEQIRRWPAEDHPAFVFTNEWDGPIQQQPFAAVFTRARDRIGLPDWATPHDLRHFYASTLIRSGASVKVIQTRLGHSSAKTTLDTYGHLFPDEEDRTRAAIDEALGRPTSQDSRVTSVSQEPQGA